MGRQRTTIVPAEVIKIIQCSQKSQYSRDYEVEDRLIDEVKREFHGRDYYTFSDSRMLRDRYEDKLFSHSSIDSYVKEDEWTHEPVLISLQTWYEYKIKIKFEAFGKQIGKEISYTDNGKDLSEGDILFVTLAELDADAIISIEPRNRELFYKLFIFAVAILLLLIVIIPVIYVLIS